MNLAWEAARVRKAWTVLLIFISGYLEAVLSCACAEGWLCVSGILCRTAGLPLDASGRMGLLLFLK